MDTALDKEYGDYQLHETDPEEEHLRDELEYVDENQPIRVKPKTDFQKKICSITGRITMSQEEFQSVQSIEKKMRPYQPGGKEIPLYPSQMIVSWIEWAKNKNDKRSNPLVIPITFQILLRMFKDKNRRTEWLSQRDRDAKNPNKRLEN